MQQIKNGSPTVAPPVAAFYRPLGDGLVLRQATPEDKEKIIEFIRLIFGQDEDIEMIYLMEGLHPGFRPEDVLLVVDQNDRIISSMCLLEVDWQLGETHLRIGQPEFVGTLEEYRGRGLIRQQFEVIHQWLKDRDLPIATIGGIYYYYRQFGYNYAIEITRLGTFTPEKHAALIKMPPGVEVRKMVESDVPALLKLAEAVNAEVDLSSKVYEQAWRWYANTNSIERNAREDWVVLQDGEIIGSGRLRERGENRVMQHLTGSETAAAALVATVLALPNLKKLTIGAHPDSRIGRWVAQQEPEKQGHSYAWYVRIDDPMRAFQKLQGEFERRIASSNFAGLSRELDLSFYRFGLKLTFESGKIIAINPLPREIDPKNGIPLEILPQVMLGYRDLDQLAEVYPDLTGKEDWELLKVLFPRLKTYVRFFI